MARRWGLTAIAVAAGLGLLVWQIQRTGADNISRGLLAVGWWGAAAILVLSFLRFAARSTGWSALIPVDVPLGHAVAAMLAGEAAGSLTPLSFAVSEPTKAAYLGRSIGGLGTRGALAALAAETYIFGVSVGIYIIAGAAALLYAYRVDSDLRLAGIAALALATAGLALAAFMAWRKPKVLTAVLERVTGPSALVDHVHAFEQLAYGSTAHPGSRLGVVIMAAAMFHALSFLELWLTLWLVTGESHAAAAFILDTVGRLTNVLFKVIPLQLGVLQIGSELVGRAIGLPPGVGVTVSLVRTVRILAWSAVGLFLLVTRSEVRS
ncbi:MAG TPA: lysylphosphatidylglycerol synthase domain-containing protein [Vicinamibacterales bacterium]|nr:lysylphosphatidylglycerol synthase domain-containing protein [Vicinamibacterales bacterium]